MGVDARPLKCTISECLLNKIFIILIFSFYCLLQEEESNFYQTMAEQKQGDQMMDADKLCTCP